MCSSYSESTWLDHGIGRQPYAPIVGIGRPACVLILLGIGIGRQACASVCAHAHITREDVTTVFHIRNLRVQRACWS